jgi:hypothetical protein
VPNGNPDFDFAAQEEWFLPIASAVTSFSESHGLLIDKYYHEGASWDLRFRHPRGGNASVAIYNGGAKGALIGSIWYLDDYDKFTRYSHSRPPRVIEKNSTAILKALEVEFVAILAVSVGEWTEVTSGYERIWSQYPKQQFEEMGPRYPLPKV